MLKLYPGKGISYLITAFFPCTVFAQPVINAVTPSYGPVNTTVTIIGNNFSATPSGNIVWFGSVQAPVTAASSGSLTVTVPTGVSYQPITVTTGGLTSTPVAPFITTFSDTGQFKPTAFSTRLDIPTGLGPQFICNADLDGDGKPDLIVADGDSNTVDIYRNTSTPGSISFVEVASYIMGTNDYPIGVAAGDIDGDGKPEIVVSNYYSQNISIFLNTSTPGNISMATAINYPSGNYAVGASIADMNGDGKQDVILACQGNNFLSVYTNSSTIGHISFSNETSFNAPAGGSPFKVVVADLDGDGKPDMAAANSNLGTVSVYLNTSPAGGAVSFAPHKDFNTGNFPEGMAIGDLDGDGLPDLAVANNTDNTLSLLRNTSTPGNLSFAAQITVPSGNSVYDLVISDLDGDGKPDLAVDDQYGSTVSIHKNISTPGAISVSPNVDYPTGSIPFSITAADFDGDGKPDLATANDADATITILRNKGSNEPSITSFTPAEGSTGTVVTITGVNFTGITNISFGDTAATSFTVVSPTTITATVGGGASGSVSLSASTGAASLAGFTYGAPPLIKSFSPDSAANGSNVSISGKGFTGVDTVTFGGTPALSFTVLNDSTIAAVVGVGSSGVVAVTSPMGTGILPGFLYIYTPIPTVVLTGFLPDSAGPGATLTITGKNLSGINAISLGGTPVQSFRIFSDSVIYVTVGEGSTGDLVVSGNNGADMLPGFVYIQPAPPPPPPLVVNITSFSPASGSTGTTVSIKGSQLTGASSVSFGGTPAISFTVISDSLILAVVGSGSTGEITVANYSSADSLPGFVYTFDSTRHSDSTATFQLLSFFGGYSGSDPLLQWQTANEGIISFYALERSSDGNQFVVIATVTPNGDDSVNHAYTFDDAGHNPGLNYYRLRMQDTTATYSYSATIAVQPPSNSHILILYPNPVIYGFTYVTLPDFNSNSIFQLLDMSGKAIKTQSIQAGAPQVRVDFSGVIPGVYKLVWSNGPKSAYQTVLVLAR